MTSAKDDEAKAIGTATSRFAVLVTKGGRSERAAQVLADPRSLVAAFSAVEGATTEAARHALGELEQDLAAAFLLSPESVELDSMSSYEQLFAFGRIAFGRTVFALTGAEFARLLFDVLPQKVMLEADDAAPLIADLRLFFAFLDRVFGHVHARACLEVLGADAVTKLGAAIAQGANFSRERAIIAEGTRAGFDMYTREGIEAFVAHKRAEAAKREAN
jgi:hypothetical protein